MQPIRIALGATLLSWATVAGAEPFDSTLIARQGCPATVSIRGGENPGSILLVPGERYRVVARNKSQPTHYQLRIEGAQPRDRWVAVTCGSLAEEAAARAGSVGKQRRSMSGQLVLAASWLPAFCERFARKPECRGQGPERTDARAFSLHGLWPQPIGNKYCGVPQGQRAMAESGDWGRLPEPDLDTETRDALRTRMPGVHSDLDRYEWIKHGSCYGTDADAYFDHAMVLLDQLNASAVRALFVSNLGRRLRASDVRRAFDRSFGAGAGDRVRLACDDDGLITELRIGLQGSIGDDSDLGKLIHAAPTRTVGCRGGWVDRAGRGR